MREEQPQSDSGQPRYAEVALPIPLDKTFTYQVPEGMASGVFVGRRVVVPFGGRLLNGVVVAVATTCPLPASSLKPIERLTETFLPAALLQISDWMASYYGCSRGEAMRSVLPPSLRKPRARRRYQGMISVADPQLLGGGLTIASPAFDRVRGELGRARGQLALMEALVTAGGRASMETATGEWGASRAVVEGLVGKGFVTIGPVERKSSLDGIDSAVETLTEAQRLALGEIQTAIGSRVFKPLLLYGVTGSGKTEVYLRAARYALDQGGGCIVLVPEIGLLPQATARYRRTFGADLAVVHSRLTGAERYQIWEDARRGACRVVIGPRSAVFNPVKNLRLIVVDEEHDDSYKQDDKPRYHARSVALMRGKLEGVAVVLGSATPSAESLRQVERKAYGFSSLPTRVSDKPLPRIEIVDMRAETERATDDRRGASAARPSTPWRGSFFSETLAEALEENIGSGRQSIIFLNKRGHARFVQCAACGWVAACKNCDISLTYHRVGNRLKCHFCGYSRAGIARCDVCKSPRLVFSGVGTQRVELDLRTMFPGAAVLRMDADTTGGKEGHRRILEEFGTGRFPILLGTQMVVKGHHFPGVSLVGVLYAEEGLNFPDFRSAERTFQQLTQVAGRSGRGSEPGRVIVQTYMPDHYVFRFLEAHDYDGFMREETEFRRRLRYPPFARLVLAACSSGDEEKLRVFMEEWAATVRRRLTGGGIDVLGPTPPLVARVRNRYREQLLFKGELRQGDKDGILGAYQAIIERRKLSRTIELRWDVDPESFV